MQRMSVLSAKRHSSVSSSAGSSLDIPSSPSSAAVASEAAIAPKFPVEKGEVEEEEDSSSSSGCEPDFAYEKTYRSSITVQIEDHPL